MYHRTFQIYGFIQAAIPLIQEYVDGPGICRNGGCFYIAAVRTHDDAGAVEVSPAHTCTTVMLLPVGGTETWDPRRWEKYCRLASEKAHRLASHPEHRTSFESRDEAKEQYGGAVRVGAYIFSFSGLPEEWDEALSLYVAVQAGQLKPREALDQASEKSGPPLQTLLMKLCKWS